MFTEEEFTQIPAYSKAKLSLDVLNQGVKEFTEKMRHREKIINTHFTKLTNEDRMEVQKMREKEGQIGRGKAFLLHDDFKDSTVLNQDKKGRKIIEILRMKKRITAVKVDGKIFYFLNK